MAINLKVLFSRLENSITAYDLFAAGVVAMGIGRLAKTFGIDSLALELPLRILLPVFMIPVGYNVGRRVDWRIVACAASIIFTRWLFFNHWYYPPLGNVPLTFLVMIIIARAVIEPLMAFALRGKIHFWAVSITLAALVPWLHHHFVEYGSLGLLLAMCGWLARNRGQETAKIVDVREYFVLVLAYYLAINQSIYQFTIPSFLIVAAGAGYVFYLCYNFKSLLLNSLRRRPADIVSKTCHYVGRNSLELYTLFVLVSYVLFYYTLTRPF
jgi:hypothetical protein